MRNKASILYISGSLGLGHITRDMAIAAELRRLLPSADITWLAADPATKVLQESGERLVEGAEAYANENLSAEQTAQGASLNLLSYLLRSRRDWHKNAAFFLDLVARNSYDLVIGDETYEISLALREHPERKRFPFAMILDFVGLDAMTRNPLEHLGVYYWNLVWSRDYRRHLKPSYDLGIFVGELEDIPDKTFGFGLPKRRDFARARYTFVGYVFPFAVSRYAAKQEVRQQLGYGPEPLAICSIGGTSIGRKLPELCAKAFALAQQKRPDLRMVLATGPRVSAESIELSRGITARGFLPRLYEHFAAGDLAIVQGGATSTFELTALRRPFIYFPIEGHCEQANVSRNLSRRGAGVPMTLSRTTPELLAGKILELIDSTPSYPDIPVDGARKAAQAILKLLDRREQPEAAPRQTMAGPSPFLPSTK